MSHAAARLVPPPENASTTETTLSPNELQVVKYANECASHGVRSYATGFLVEDCDITLWYMDRMGVIKSSSFNFITQPHLLVYFIASVTLASLKQLGFLSLMNFPDARTPAQLLGAYQDVSISLPHASDIQGCIHDGLHFDVAISDKRRMLTNYGAIGRATIIVPLKGNETTLVVCADASEPMVCKISWQSRWRVGEDANIRIIRTKLEESESKKSFLDHIVDMKCSATYSMHDMDLPRAKMFGIADPIHERVCRVLVLREYLPLHRVSSAAEFQCVFLDTVRGKQVVMSLYHPHILTCPAVAHHAVFESTRILHRDISPNNLMFYYRASADGEKAIGVLCDWDLSRELPQPGEDTILDDLLQSGDEATRNKILTFEQLQAAQPTVYQPSAGIAAPNTETSKEPRYRTGTGPFIALDILNYNRTPHHLYRHDLESFFWVLAWFVICFDPDTGEVKHIDAWLKDSFNEIGHAKAEFIMKGTVFDSISAGCHREYQHILKKWVRRLADRLIAPVHDMYDDFQTNIVDRMRMLKRPGSRPKGTVEDVAKDLRALVSRREDILTYHAFMKCLRADP